ncbi:MAG: isocitrate lyase/phosphoenolpyruvate mutase family protein [Bacteroidota bacterium]
MTFKSLHEDNNPILISNVWDVQSAQIAQQLGFKAIGTSSGAIATMLGYADGEEISFKELKYIVERITKSVTIPLSVDLEAGYSQKPNEVADHIDQLIQLGVKGVNLEDSTVDKGNRQILDVEVFTDRLYKICDLLQRRHISVFMNVRTDTFLLGLLDPVLSTLKRGKQYKNAGADGLFVPCIKTQKDIEAVVQGVSLPLNVMCVPKLPDFATLQQLGVKRISMGNFVCNKMNEILKKELEHIQQNQSFHSIFT